ncbi:MAG: hypothetical protein QOJ80_3887 [Mycobacterium sp.]|jgi:hypothetical protein|nr:hypothetical protein [Mycobacterium sp.]
MTSASSAGETTSMSHDKQPNDAVFPVKALLETLGAIAGASALLSALMLYFGWVRTRVLYDYFGVPVGVLRYSTTDFVLRSADVFFQPVIWSILALAGLVAVLIGTDVLDRRITKWWLHLLLRAALAAAASACAVTGALGLVGAVDPWSAAVSLCISGVLIVMQYVFYRRATVLRPPVIVVVIGLMLTVAATFWTVSIYAAGTGTSIAANIATGTLPRPAATVHSKTDLGIAGIQQQNSRAPVDTQSWPFTYGGYKLLAYANDRWFLISQHWQAGSPTIILPDNDSLRIELAAS